MLSFAGRLVRQLDDISVFVFLSSKFDLSNLIRRWLCRVLRLRRLLLAEVYSFRISYLAQLVIRLPPMSTPRSEIQ